MIFCQFAAFPFLSERTAVPRTFITRPHPFTSLSLWVGGALSPPGCQANDCVPDDSVARTMRRIATGRLSACSSGAGPFFFLLGSLMPSCMTRHGLCTGPPGSRGVPERALTHPRPHTHHYAGTIWVMHGLLTGQLPGWVYALCLGRGERALPSYAAGQSQ